LRDERALEVEWHKRAPVWEKARALVGQWLCEGQLTLFIVDKQNPRARYAWALAKIFWEDPDRDHTVLQGSILDRREDLSGRWHYALDGAEIAVLLAESTPDGARQTPQDGAAPKEGAPSDAPAVPAPITNQQRRRDKLAARVKKDFAADLKRDPPWLPDRDELGAVRATARCFQHKPR